MPSYQSSKLWMRSLAPRPGDPSEKDRTRLRSAYEVFWQRANLLAQRISSDLPGLTLHDENHLSALWHCADLLIKDTYELNPLEAFVFGGAVLLHDTGHAFSAFEGGLSALKSSTEYQDALELLISRRRIDWDGTATDTENPPSNLEEQAIFSTLRQLHAAQSKKLADRKFDDQYLIDDSEVRSSLGQIIGQIAASHAWDRSALVDRLGSERGSPAFLGAGWPLNPLKIACLLRCADAIQIDERRAFAFAQALHQPRGVSQLHWIAQQLGQPQLTPDDSGPGAIRFTSQRDFPEENADAWWIALDLVRTAHDELQGCYALMRDYKLAPFAADRVDGSESPSRLARFIKTSGWEPVAAEFRVTSVQHMVRLFGREAMYGHDVSVPIRELIQNAADAIRARKALQNDPFYKGNIAVSFRKPQSSTGQYTVSVKDNGIGMSPSVLTGTLLEFGKSLWTSDEVRFELPGFASKRLDQTGRYGIGFFSVLMVSAQVTVTSKRYDRADAPHSVKIRNGMQLRPLLTKEDPAILGSFSTDVTMSVASADVEKMLQAGNLDINPTLDRPIKRLTPKELIAHLCPCLDCNINIVEDDRAPELAHSEAWASQDALPWLKSILLSDYLANPPLDNYLSDASRFMRTIESPTGQIEGRAAIAFGSIPSGIDSIGGLISGHNSRKPSQFSESFIGVLGTKPSGPSRLWGQSRSENVSIWASEQGRILSTSGISRGGQYIAALNIASFGGDPTPVAHMSVDREMRSLVEIYAMLNDLKCLSVAIQMGSRDEGHTISTVSFSPENFFSFGINTKDIRFTEGRVLEGYRYGGTTLVPYLSVNSTQPQLRGSFLWCLERMANQNHRRLEYNLVAEAVLATYVGRPSERDGLFENQKLIGPAIRVTINTI